MNVQLFYASHSVFLCIESLMHGSLMQACIVSEKANNAKVTLPSLSSLDHCQNQARYLIVLSYHYGFRSERKRNDSGGNFKHLVLTKIEYKT